MTESHHGKATTIAELGQALSFYVERMDEKLAALSDQVAAASAMARDDIKELKAAISLMASRVELDHRLALMKAEFDGRMKALADDLERNKPGTLLKVFTAVMAALSLSGAVFVMFQESVSRRQAPPVQQPVSPAPQAPKTP